MNFSGTSLSFHSRWSFLRLPDGLVTYMVCPIVHADMKVSVTV
jgi:hypothetical protein